MTGQTIWVYDPSYTTGQPTNLGSFIAALAYLDRREGNSGLYRNNDAYLIAIDAKNGQPVATLAKPERSISPGHFRLPLTRETTRLIASK